MSRRRWAGLSKEELEVQQVLSPPGSQSTLSATPTRVIRVNTQGGPVPGSEAPLPPRQELEELFGQMGRQMSRSLVASLSASGVLRDPSSESATSDSDGDVVQEIDSELPLPTGVHLGFECSPFVWGECE